MGGKARDTGEALAGGGAAHALNALCQVLSDELVARGSDWNCTVAHRAVRVGAAEGVSVVAHFERSTITVVTVLYRRCKIVNITMSAGTWILAELSAAHFALRVS